VSLIIYTQRKNEILAANNLKTMAVWKQVTQWLITQEKGCWRQGTEKLDATEVPEFLQGQYWKIPRGLRHESAVARFPGILVRISPGTWIFVSSERCLFSGTGLCDGLITRPEEFSVFECDR